jgi:hypothetical protein
VTLFGKKGNQSSEKESDFPEGTLLLTSNLSLDSTLQLDPITSGPEFTLPWVHPFPSSPPLWHVLSFWVSGSEALDDKFESYHIQALPDWERNQRERSYPAR